MATILYSVEDAAYQFYASSSLSSSLSVYPGMNNADKEAPCIVCYADDAVQEFDKIFVWHVRTNIIVKTMAEDMTNKNADSLADTTFENICDPSTVTALGTYSDTLTVYDIQVKSMNRTFDGDAWITSLILDIVAVNNS